MHLTTQSIWSSGLALIFLTTTLAAAEPSKDAISPKTDVIKLFDGKSLDGFYTYLQDTKYEDPRKVFRITEGLLHITGDGLGSIITKQTYRDYHLVLEFKWGPQTWKSRLNATRDSGLLVHSTGSDGAYNGIWMQSIEVQIIEGGMGDFLLVSGNGNQGEKVPIAMTCESDRDRDGEVIWKKGGQRERFDPNNSHRINWYGRDPDWEDKLGFRGKEDLDSPIGSWNRFDVFCEGEHIQTYFNGVLVNEGFDVFPSAGRLQLQTELAEIFVRRWELWPLGKGPKPDKPTDP